MRTRHAPDETTPLPPPPAPPARDANPWPMPTQDAHPAGPGKALPRVDGLPGTGTTGGNGKSALPGVAVAVGFALLLLAIAVIRFRESGNIDDLTGPVFAAVMLLIFAVSSARRGARSRRRRGGDSTASR